jgi:ATP-dependent Zn protease
MESQCKAQLTLRVKNFGSIKKKNAYKGRLTGDQNLKSGTKAKCAITSSYATRLFSPSQDEAQVRGSGRLSFGPAQMTEHLNRYRWSTIDRPKFSTRSVSHTLYKGLPAISFATRSNIESLEEGSDSRLLKYRRIPQGKSFGTYSKDRSAVRVASVGSNQFVDLTKRIFSRAVAVQDDLNISTESLFEPVSTSSWFLIYRLFLALILKEVFKYIYRISLKDFSTRLLNSSLGHAISSPGLREAVQSEPFPEFYKPKKRLKDSSGLKNALLPLSEIIWFFRSNCRSRSGITPRGVILLGPDGVDKAGIAQAVAGEAKVPIIVHSLRALTLTHSHPQKRLEKLLLLARAQSPCILFLDELDLIGQAREGVIRNSSGDGDSPINFTSSSSLDRYAFRGDDRSQSQSPDDHHASKSLQGKGRRVDLMLRLLTVMDGLQHLNGVVIITTSKNSATLDPALLRPGRFDRLIHLTLPNHENRVELFKAKTRQLGHTQQMPWEYLSLRTAKDNMGGADILSAINYSILRAIVNDTVHTVETLEYGLNCVKALNAKRGKPQSSSLAPPSASTGASL